MIRTGFKTNYRRPDWVFRPWDSFPFFGISQWIRHQNGALPMTKTPSSELVVSFRISSVGSRIIHCLLYLCSALLLFANCTNNPVSTGGGDEGEAKAFALSGVIRNADGTPASNAIVHLRSSDYVAQANEYAYLKGNVSFSRDIRTDNNGWFRVDTLTTGAYTISAFDHNRTNGVMISYVRDCDSGSDTILQNHLGPTGMVKGELKNIPSTSPVTAIIPGLERYKPVDIDGRFLLTNIPRGEFQILFATKDSSIYPAHTAPKTLTPSATIQCRINFDSLIVASILYSNHITNLSVDSISKRDTTNRHIISVRLVDRGIDTLPPEIGNLRFLRELHLTNNDLGHIPELLGKLQALEVLNLSGNSIDWIPSTIKGCASLKHVHLNGNRIIDIPESFTTLQQIQVLDLSMNPIGILPDSIGALPNLQRLYVNRCQLREIPNSIGNCLELKTFEGAGNDLRSLPPSFCDLLSLTNCDVSSNSLDSLPSAFGQLESLQRLQVHHNSLTDLPPTIAQCANIISLDLGYNKLRRISGSVKQWADTHDPDWYNTNE